MHYLRINSLVACVDVLIVSFVVEIELLRPKTKTKTINNSAHGQKDSNSDDSKK